MSLLLFPHARHGNALRIRLLLVGAATGLALVVLTALLGASYLGVITDDVAVEARLTTTGDSLGVNSDVKFRGLRVGRVLDVEPGAEPSARIVLMEEHVDRIPTGVRARVLPGTLFGNEYVELVEPGEGGDPLSEGDVIAADTSAATLRLMDTFTATQRLLGAVDPARLDTAMSQLAAALDGRGDDLARFVDDADQMLATWARTEPAFYQDLELLATNVETLADIEPQLVAALRDSLPIARTIAQQERQSDRLMAGSTTLIRDLATFLDVEETELARVLQSTAATLSVFASRYGAFERTLLSLPPVLANGAEAVQGNRIQMEGVLAPQFPDAYTPADCPRYGHLVGRNCLDAPSGRSR